MHAVPGGLRRQCSLTWALRHRMDMTGKESVTKTIQEWGGVSLLECSFSLWKLPPFHSLRALPGSSPLLLPHEPPAASPPCAQVRSSGGRQRSPVCLIRDSLHRILSDVPRALGCPGPPTGSLISTASCCSSETHRLRREGAEDGAWREQH